MDVMNISEKLQKILSHMEYIPNHIGHSAAQVYRYKKEDKAYYLKIQDSNEETQKEYEVMKWLYGKLPVPEIVHWERNDGVDYLLMSEVKGEMACSKNALSEPMLIVQVLAEGIEKLHGVDITHCPFENTLEYKLKAASENVLLNKVDMSHWEQDTEFKSPEALLQYLQENRPPEEFVFTHGDYCLPNIFYRDTKISGFIDLGRAGIADRWQDISLCVRSLGNISKRSKSANWHLRVPLS